MRRLKASNVLLVEDILDTGITLGYLRGHLQLRRPRSLRIAALLDKPSRRREPIEADYVGFTVPDNFRGRLWAGLCGKISGICPIFASSTPAKTVNTPLA
jgi:pyrimidine operon attenuation protein/uracil phosphoribosyltransferase